MYQLTDFGRATACHTPIILHLRELVKKQIRSDANRPDHWGESSAAASVRMACHGTPAAWITKMIPRVATVESKQT